MYNFMFSYLCKMAMAVAFRCENAVEAIEAQICRNK